MTASNLNGSLVRVQGAGGRPARVAVAPRAQYQPTGQPGDRILPLLRTPADMLAMGPRVALGALASLPQTLQNLPADVERLTSLVQDPRPVEQKQAEVLEVLEGRVVGYMEAGTFLEGDILTTVAAAIPDALRDALPQEVRDALAAPRRAPGDSGDYYYSGGGAAPAGGAGGKPLATWTITTSDSEGEGAPPPPPMTPAELSASQTAAEVAEIRDAVSTLREALAKLQASTDAGAGPMLRLNVREAQAALGRRLEQVAPKSRTSADPSLAAAMAEAEQLLAEVQALP